MQDGRSGAADGWREATHVVVRGVCQSPRGGCKEGNILPVVQLEAPALHLPPQTLVALEAVMVLAVTVSHPTPTHHTHQHTTRQARKRTRTNHGTQRTPTGNSARAHRKRAAAASCRVGSYCKAEGGKAPSNPRSHTRRAERTMATSKQACAHRPTALFWCVMRLHMVEMHLGLYTMEAVSRGHCRRRKHTHTPGQTHAQASDTPTHTPRPGREARRGPWYAVAR
jgi:hypothetical protein